jgi:hypothetical protein
MSQSTSYLPLTPEEMNIILAVRNNAVQPSMPPPTAAAHEQRSLQPVVPQPGTAPAQPNSRHGSLTPPGNRRRAADHSPAALSPRRRRRSRSRSSSSRRRQSRSPYYYNREPTQYRQNHYWRSSSPPFNRRNQSDGYAATAAAAAAAPYNNNRRMGGNRRQATSSTNHQAGPTAAPNNRRANQKRLPENLQELLVNCPSGHPSKSELDALEEGKWLTINDVSYVKSEGSIIVLAKTRHHCDLNHKESSNTVVPSGPVLHLSDPTNQDEVWKVNNSTPANLRRHRDLFLPITNDDNKEHRGQGKLCHCFPNTFAYKQINAVSDVCLKKEYTTGKGEIIPFDNMEEKYAPNKRPYLYSASSNKPTLMVPSPFLLNFAWAPKPYLPTNSQEPPSTRLALFYTLYSSDQYREQKKPFMEDPINWTSTNHPMFGEPESFDELWQWSKDLYGVETLPRVLLPRHPCRDAKIRIYSCTSSDFTVPVISGGYQAETLIESYIENRLFPFFAEGAGEIICPVCLFNISGSACKACTYSRSKFVEHFIQCHHRNLVTAGLAFSTSYNSRMFEALVIYLLSRANAKSGSDQVAHHPFTLGPIDSIQEESDDCLRKFLSKLAGNQSAMKLREEPETIKEIALALNMLPTGADSSHPGVDSESSQLRRTRAKSKPAQKKISIEEYKARTAEPARPRRDGEDLLDQISEDESGETPKAE